MSNTATRIIVALIAAPIIIGLVIAGHWWFWGFVQLLALLSLKELYDLGTNTSALPQYWTGYAGSLLIGLYFMLADTAPQAFAQLLFPALVLSFVLGVLIIELLRNKPHPLWNAAITIFGVMYIGTCVTSLVGLRMAFTGRMLSAPVLQPFLSNSSLEERLHIGNVWGTWLVFVTFLSIWTCDSLAFFAGKAFGNHKLFPRVSPNKSWEGAIVGFLGASILFLVLSRYLLPFLPPLHAVVLGGIVGAIGQLGDLVESLFKRDAGVKDSSNIIPGHGGVYDRFDAAMFVAPVVYLYIHFFLLFAR
ncbi:MAG: phosphatidate cytidylyltransferase [Bacteroidota bacterium]|nr:phosphatidate cytidylyltransferase [Candidatus Kapabacteria bacterium]MDW8219377.1 phosphatidate cytidylyltransferase [Bacteroidota bacterium]